MQIISDVEKVLSELFKGRVRLDTGQTLRSSHRSNVSRLLILEGPPGIPQSVIVKQALAAEGEVFNPELREGPSRRLFNEWAGLQFLTETVGAASPTPRFYAGDRGRGLLVLEDLGSCKGLDHFLLGDDPHSAEEMLVAFAATLGRMHALTMGKQSEFERIRVVLGLQGSGQRGDGGERLSTMLRTMAEGVGVEPGPGIDDELKIVNKNFTEPGPFLAYLHRDPCPDNCLITDKGLKLVDFETSGYGHALVDGIYGRIHFPTCWCVNRMPDHIPLRMETAYRAELIKACPEAADDELFHRLVVEGCAACVIFAHHASTLLEDVRWGISTMRQRALLRFDIFCQMTEEFDHMKSVGATVRAIAEKLRALWPPEADAMPYYPAFRSTDKL